MTASLPLQPRKRPVNLTLSEDLVQEAKALSGNLSATVEAMLTEYVARARGERAQRQREADAACREWNAVLDAMGGSFADDHSTL
ncbi:MULTISPECIES: type II toxin-antitoxin system CcdA family antitoxin [unclassified Ottowia]|jgi:antitoxin CcdA|uniref:type II toxin-antitoxin system CcdA family antitoxin n=1 Tax=unclassified Ottowia TaxID=2645081 RepID=UPI0029535FAE|nr:MULTISPECIES: type II toxin-antitoxin system CcdA family antitoxin [unclassified Ottowia]WOP13999.1 type II toxin-antitoxin system CcdA family antitoxin [Ottowia sp. SB7-C50]HOB66076.1 type II toxin-antitoxin system CcdA family antitoxin [Ottowia sp.]HPZ56024.1 type II toxin-antitoxin system CcdA family antitoxin [Ottowia sp.]HQD47859.1 type II toxin-antitoxin system CcdA family antitoxin [Ottowia sp.]